jgi:Lon protease-like protein
VQRQERFRITQRNHLVHGLWIASVSQLDRDLSIPIPEDLKKTATALTQVLAHPACARCAEPRSRLLPTPEQLDDCGWVANRWCELLPVPMELKQRLMELDNPLVRLELVGDVLERTGIGH